MLRLLVRLYQLAFRPLLGLNCRFVPSCSDYALDALAAHGAIHGSGLAVRRVLRCNPWCVGGHDPVPGAPILAPALNPSPLSKSRAVH